MSKQKNKNPAGASQPRKKTPANHSLSDARRMLPLVSRIVTDIRDSRQALARLEVEQESLDRRKRQLDWTGRSRRYQVTEDIASTQKRLEESAEELDQLSLVMVDPAQGEVAFPTMLGSRPAFYLWKVGEADVGAWCYDPEGVRHPIPGTAPRN